MLKCERKNAKKIWIENWKKERREKEKKRKREKEKKEKERNGLLLGFSSAIANSHSSTLLSDQLSLPIT